MRHSLESLATFVEAASAGSFSAAARALGKSQSTVSETIANLEVDLDLRLFDRGQRQAVLTEQGQVMLDLALQVLAANDRLNRSASQLSGGLEARLTVALSDTYQSDAFENTLAEIDQSYPDLQLECIIAEHDDLLELVQRGRAQLGLLAAQTQYPADIAQKTLSELSEITLCAARSHPLASLAQPNADDLKRTRALRLNAHGSDAPTVAQSNTWSAPGYLMLLEMATLGFGWTELPRWMVERFGRDLLIELPVPGWPRHIPIDVVWSTRRKLGPAGAWLLERVSRN